MPEGPEAATMAGQMKELIVGRDIVGYTMSDLVDYAGYGNIDKTFPQKVVDVYAVGKRPVIKTDKGWFISYLGMTGGWFPKKMKHSHLTLDFGRIEYDEDRQIVVLDMQLHYCDARRFGHVTFVDNKKDYKKYFSQMGQDLIHNPVDEKRWISDARACSGKTKICAFLLKPSINCTIGNYLCSEILYYAKIRPDRSLESLSDKELKTILHVAVKVSKYSLSKGGFTMRDYYTPLGHVGTYKCVCYGRSTDPKGREISSGVIAGGRTSYWVESLQK